MLSHTAFFLFFLFKQLHNARNADKQIPQNNARNPVNQRNADVKLGLHFKKRNRNRAIAHNESQNNAQNIKQNARYEQHRADNA